MAATATEAAAHLRGALDAYGRALACPACAQTFDDPVRLPCGHTFCRACTAEASECAACSVPFFPADRTSSPATRSNIAVFVAARRRAEAHASGALPLAAEPGPELPASPQARQAWWRAYVELSRKLDAAERLLRDEPEISSAAARALLRGALGQVGDWQPCEQRGCALCAAAAADGPAPPCARRTAAAHAAGGGQPARGSTRPALAAADPLAQRSARPASAATDARGGGGGGGKRARGGSSAERAPAPPLPSAREVALVLSTLPEESAALARQACRALSGASLHKAWTAGATHVITEAREIGGRRLASRTFKYLCAILRGQWVVSSAWVRASLEQGAWVAEGAYELDGDMATGGRDGPAKGRAAHAAGRSAIFAGLHVYLHGKFEHPNPARAQLVALLGLGGASVCASFSALQNEAVRARAPGAALALCDEAECGDDFRRKCAQLRIPVLSPGWLMDSISHVACLDFSPAESEYRLDGREAGSASLTDGGA